MPWHSIKQGLKCFLDRPQASAEERKVGRTRSHFRSLSYAHSSLEKDKLDDIQMPICLFNHNASDFAPGGTASLNIKGAGRSSTC